MRLSRKPVSRHPIDNRAPFVRHLVRKLSRRLRPPDSLNPIASDNRQALAVFGLWPSSAHREDPSNPG